MDIVTVGSPARDGSAEAAATKTTLSQWTPPESAPTPSIVPSATATEELNVKLFVQQRYWNFCSDVIVIPKAATILRLKNEICTRAHGEAVSSSDIVFLSTMRPKAGNVISTLNASHQSYVNVQMIKTPPSEIGMLKDCIPGVAEYRASTSRPTTPRNKSSDRPKTPALLQDVLILTYDIIPSTPLTPRIKLNVPISACPLLDVDLQTRRARDDAGHDDPPRSLAPVHILKMHNTKGWRTIQALVGVNKLDNFANLVQAARTQDSQQSRS